MHKRHTKQDTETLQPVFALNVKQTCKALGNITPPTFYKEVAAGKIKTFKIRNRRFSTPEACREYIAAQEKEAE